MSEKMGEPTQNDMEVKGNNWCGWRHQWRVKYSELK